MIGSWEEPERIERWKHVASAKRDILLTSFHVLKTNYGSKPFEIRLRTIYCFLQNIGDDHSIATWDKVSGE
jgi:hypothetical protein